MCETVRRQMLQIHGAGFAHHGDLFFQIGKVFARVTIASTPGIFSAADVSIFNIFACACGLHTVRHTAMFGGLASPPCRPPCR